MPEQAKKPKVKTRVKKQETKAEPKGDEQKHPGGRPSKYDDKALETSRDYVINYEKKYDDVIPTIAGLAVLLKVRRETIYEWLKNDELTEFSNTVEELLATQEKILLKNGLMGAFNANITKLVLSSHGYSDRSQVENSGEQKIVVETRVRRENNDD